MAPEFIVLCIFTGLVAVALLLQGIALLAIASRVRDLSSRTEATGAKITKQVEALAAQAEGFIPPLKSMLEKINALEDNLTGISKVAHERTLKVDAFLGEATDSARLQMAKLQDVIDTTSLRINDTVTSLQDAVNAPLTEVQAIARGIRTGMDVLFGRRRSSSNRSHQDEEMFI